MNNNDKSHAEKTSNDKKTIGFDFQYYYFLYKLISIKTNQVIGLEVKDDVHIEDSNSGLARVF